MNDVASAATRQPSNFICLYRPPEPGLFEYSVKIIFINFFYPPLMTASGGPIRILLSGERGERNTKRKEADQTTPLQGSSDPFREEWTCRYL